MCLEKFKLIFTNLEILESSNHSLRQRQAQVVKILEVWHKIQEELQ